MELSPNVSVSKQISVRCKRHVGRPCDSRIQKIQSQSPAINTQLGSSVGSLWKRHHAAREYLEQRFRFALGRALIRAHYLSWHGVELLGRIPPEFATFQLLIDYHRLGVCNHNLAGVRRPGGNSDGSTTLKGREDIAKAGVILTSILIHSQLMPFFYYITSLKWHRQSFLL